MRRFTAVCIALICFASLPAVQAGQSCKDHEVSVSELQSAIDIAAQIEQTLEAKQARFALLARTGSDISQHGLKHTHLGFVHKRASDSEWIVIHQLNPCASADSGLYKQGLGTFMLDDLYTHEVLLVTLPRDLQESLRALFDDGAPTRLYDPRYSMISYPGRPVKYQNSNEWLLELLALAQARVDGKTLRSRDDAHRYFLSRGFKGSVIRISPLRRSLAKITAHNIRFDDHPSSSLRTGAYETVSVNSVVDYLQRTGDAVEQINLSGPYHRTGRARLTDPISENGD